MAIVKVNFFSESLLRMVNLMCVIPIDKREMDGEGLRETDKPLKTLYLMHGIYGGEYDWITSTRLFKWAKDRNLAVILPAGENSFYSDQKAAHNYYGKFIGDELVKFTRTMFRLSDRREDTFVGGLSMGAMGAFYAALRYPDTFGYVGALSTALLGESYPKDDDPAMYLLSSRTFFETIFGKEEDYRNSGMDPYKLAADLKASGKPFPKIYMAIGENDPLLSANQDYQRYLTELGAPLEFHVDQGAHDWAFWDRNLYRILEWLPVERKPAVKIYDF